MARLLVLVRCRICNELSGRVTLEDGAAVPGLALRECPEHGRSHVTEGQVSGAAAAARDDGHVRTLRA
jgi:hypothetical protein